jgi:signal transduction histidine kinase
VGGRRIRRRLWVVLALPLAVIAAMAGLWGLDLAGDYRASAATDNQVETALAADGLILAVQRERGLTDGVLRGERAFVPLLTAERLRVDSARNSFASVADRAAGEEGSALRDAVDQLAVLDSLRTDADSPPTDPLVVLGGYADLGRSLRAAAAGGTPSPSDDERSVRGLDALRALGVAAEAATEEAGQLGGVSVAGAFRGNEYAQFTELRARRLAALSEFERYATPAQVTRIKAILAGGPAVMATNLERIALSRPTSPALGISATEWWSAATGLADDLRSLQDEVGASVRAREEGVRADALRRLGILAGLVVLAAAAGGSAVLATGRALARLLVRLADTADEIAQRQLPEAAAQLQSADPEPAVQPELPSVTASFARRDDEFARVAQAIDNLRRTALSLATEQAVLRRQSAESLANLGRRNQNLVRRQLRLISDLERDESDPNVLADLFELDHLATRMRRNAESLLVLTGDESPRRWAEPMPVPDVIRSAIAEVEDYRRVVLRRIDDIMIVGTAAAGLAHLLAELVENALSFSPPDQDVEIYARADGSGCIVAVVDHGIGMSREDLATANARLAGGERPLVTPTRFLGHHVVGRLAERLGAQVHLHESPLTGISAKVTLPAELVARPRSAAGTVTPPSEPALEPPSEPPSEPPAVPALVPPTLRDTPRELSARAQRLLRRSRQAATTAGAPTSTPEVAPATAPSPAPETATTRNGLVKRVPRRQRLEESRRPAAQLPSGQVPAAEGTPTPEQVGGKLSTLRAAVRRAEARDDSGAEPDAAQPDVANDEKDVT